MTDPAFLETTRCLGLHRRRTGGGEDDGKPSAPRRKILLCKRVRIHKIFPAIFPSAPVSWLCLYLETSGTFEFRGSS